MTPAEYIAIVAALTKLIDSIRKVKPATPITDEQMTADEQKMVDAVAELVKPRE